MDISKASNFERYVFDVVGRDRRGARALAAARDRRRFDLSGTPHAVRVAASGFVSGRSTHADRVATIRDVAARFGVVVDPHTADGIKVGLAHRDAAVPLVCIETALRKVRGDHPRGARPRPDRPAAYSDLEARPQRCERMGVDVAGLKAFIASHAS